MPSDDKQAFSVLADELLAAWRVGETIPDLAVVLRGGRGLAPEQVLELCLADQPFRWRTAEPLRVEDYLALYPALAQQPEWVFELAYGECRTRQQLGTPPAADEIAARFPGLAGRLQEQLEVGFWLDEGVAPRSPPIPVPAVCTLHQSGRFGPYELGEAIAHGGMGVVFRARHVPLNRIVALKMIRPDRIMREVDYRRFHNETVTVAQLDHPHIVPIYDVGEVHGVHYFTMKLMEGGDLQQHCRRYVDDPRVAARVMAEVAGAVHHAHQRGVLHRDVKPSNVLLDEAGQPHVTDFGLARRLDDPHELTHAGDVLGTPAYLAPEHLSADQEPLTVAADVYGLGAVLYVLLTGQPPFADEHLVPLLESIRQREPVPPRRLNRRVHADLERICLKALAKRPGDRYLSAAQFADDLQRFLSGEAVHARPLPWWRRRWRWVRRHPDLAVLGGVVLVAAVVLLTLLGVLTARLQAMRRSLDDSLRAARAGQAEAEANRTEAARLRRSAEALEDTARKAQAEAVDQRGQARMASYAAAFQRIEVARNVGDTLEFSRLLDAQVPPADEPDVRGFEWFLLDRQRPRPERLGVPLGPVRSVCYSPDGRRLAAAGELGTIQVWETASGRLAATWPSLTTTRDLAFSPDGALLAAAGDDGRVRLFPAGGGTPQAWPVAGLPLWHVAFVGDGPLLATGDEDGQIRLVDRRRGEVVATLASAPGVIQSMAVAPDGQWLVSGDGDGHLKIWELATRQAVYEFSQGTKGAIKCLAVSADGTLVAEGSTDNLVRVVRVRRPWAHQWVLAGQHFDRIQGVAFSTDGQHVAGCDKNGAVRVWRLADAAAGDSADPRPPEHAWQGHQGRAYGLAFHPHQHQLATVGQEDHVAVWTLRDAHESLALGDTGRDTGEGPGLAFSADGAMLAVAAADGVQLWNVRTRKLAARLSLNGEQRDQVTLSHDGQYLATARETPPVVEVWRKTPAGYQPAWASTDQASDGLAFSPRGDVLVVADWSGDEIVVYDAASGRVERRIPAQQTWGSQFSPDGQQLAFTEQDDIVLWDWDARQPRRRLRAHLSTVTAVAYSPDGRRLASCGRDRRIILWDAHTGEPVRTMMGHRNYPVQVAFVGTDRLVSLSDGGRILVWHAELGTQLCSLHADQANPCFHLALSPTQHWLACRLGDGTIHLLDVRGTR